MSGPRTETQPRSTVSRTKTSVATKSASSLPLVHNSGNAVHPTPDRVSLGHRVDSSMQNQKELENWARTGKNTARLGKPFFDDANDGFKLASGPLNLWAGKDTIDKEGDYGRGGLQALSGAVDTGSGLTTVCQKTRWGAASALLGKTASVLGAASGAATIVSTLLSANDAAAAAREGNEVKAIEKGMDAVAGLTLIPAALPSGSAALASATIDMVVVGEGAVAGAAGTATLAGLAVFGTAYGTTRVLSSATGLDGVVTNGFEKMVFNDGHNALEKFDLQRRVSANTSSMMSDIELAYQVSQDSRFAGQAIVGVLTDIEQGRAKNDDVAMEKAVSQLARLRRAQRGQL